jgi:hypothetical protein
MTTYSKPQVMNALMLGGVHHDDPELILMSGGGAGADGRPVQIAAEPSWMAGQVLLQQQQTHTATSHGLAQSSSGGQPLRDEPPRLDLLLGAEANDAAPCEYDDYASIENGVPAGQPPPRDPINPQFDVQNAAALGAVHGLAAVAVAGGANYDYGKEDSCVDELEFCPNVADNEHCDHIDYYSNDGLKTYGEMCRFSCDERCKSRKPAVKQPAKFMSAFRGSRKQASQDLLI